MQFAKKVFSTRSSITAVIALIVMIVAGVMYTGHVSGDGFWRGIIIANFSRAILTAKPTP